MTTQITEKALPDGLVTSRQYEQLVSSSYFQRIELFSNEFIRRTGSMIQAYNARWVADPLHQWSRQWEYPYIISQLQDLHKVSVVVDLGAGVSFLPYYIKEIIGIENVIAVDCDKNLGQLYKLVNSVLAQKVSFQYGDMRQLTDIADGSVDFAYSVSVLEHTNAYPAILREIYRILTPGGKLSVTFDISLNGLDDIPLQKAYELLDCLKNTFTDHTNVDLDREIHKDGLVTSQLMSEKDKKLMPWRFPLINVVKPLIKHRKLGSRFKKLTFCCVTVLKSAE